MLSVIVWRLLRATVVRRITSEISSTEIRQQQENPEDLPRHGEAFCEKSFIVTAGERNVNAGRYIVLQGNLRRSKNARARKEKSIAVAKMN